MRNCGAHYWSSYAGRLTGRSSDLDVHIDVTYGGEYRIDGETWDPILAPL